VLAEDVVSVDVFLGNADIVEDVFVVIKNRCLSNRLPIELAIFTLSVGNRKLNGLRVLPG